MGANCCASDASDDGQRLADVQPVLAVPPPAEGPDHTKEVAARSSVETNEDEDDDDEFWDGREDADEDPDNDVVWVRIPGEKPYLARLEAEARNGQCLVRYHSDGCVQLVDYFKLSRTEGEGAPSNQRRSHRLSQGGKTSEDVWVEWEGEWFAASVEALAGEGQVLVRNEDEEAAIVEAEHIRRASRKDSEQVTSFAKTFNRSKSKALSEEAREDWLRKAKKGVTRKIWEEAPKPVRADQEIVIAALAAAKTPFDAAIIFKHASDKLRGDKDVAVAALLAAGEDAAQGVYGAMSDKLRTDRAIVLATLEVAKPSHAGSILQQAPAVRRSDFHVARAAVRRDSNVLQTVEVTNEEQLEALRQEVGAPATPRTLLTQQATISVTAW